MKSSKLRIFSLIAILAVICSMALTTMPSSVFTKLGINSSGTLGLRITSAADVAPVTVATTTVATATQDGNQRKTFYGASRFWLFYSDNTNMVYQSSLDGITWASATTVRAATLDSMFSIWWDGTYVHYAYASAVSNEAMKYRRGTPAIDGVITWTAEATAKAANASNTYSRPFVCKDTNNKPVIAYAQTAYSSMTPYVTRDNSTDGTWPSSDWDNQMSVLGDASRRTEVLPLASGKLLCIFAKSANGIQTKFYDGAAWTSTAAATDSSIEAANQFSAVVDSSNIVHMVYLKDGDDDIKYTHWHSGGTDWEADENIWTGTSATVSPVLTKTVGDDLYCFWLGDNVSNHIFYKAQQAGSWDANPTDWKTEANVVSNLCLNSMYQETTGNLLGVSWLTGAASPYNVRFGALQRADTTGVDITIDPSDLDGNWAYEEGAGDGTSSFRKNTWYTSDNLGSNPSSGTPCFTLTNAGGAAIDVTIGSSDNWTGVGACWTVSPTGTPGNATIGIWAGLDSDTTYSILVKPDDPPNFLLTNLASAAHDHFGLLFYTCTINDGGVEMTGTVTLWAVLSE